MEKEKKSKKELLSGAWRELRELSFSFILLICEPLTQSMTFLLKYCPMQLCHVHVSFKSGCHRYLVTDPS